MVQEDDLFNPGKIISTFAASSNRSFIEMALRIYRKSIGRLWLNDFEVKKGKYFAVR
jgi:hypothetical protein